MTQSTCCILGSSDYAYAEPFLEKKHVLKITLVHAGGFEETNLHKVLLYIIIKK